MLLTCIAILNAVGLIAVLHQTNQIKRKITTMSTKEQLDAAIAALPASIETAVTAAVQPVIDAIKAKAGDTDFQAEIDALNAIPASVSGKIAADLTPPADAAPAAPAVA